MNCKEMCIECMTHFKLCHMKLDITYYQTTVVSLMMTEFVIKVLANEHQGDCGEKTIHKNILM
jgi:hypothetical protein